MSVHAVNDIGVLIQFTMKVKIKSVSGFLDIQRAPGNHNEFLNALYAFHIIINSNIFCHWKW